MVSDDLKIKMLMTVAVVGIGAYAAYKITGGFKQLVAAVPQVVKDGAEAVGQLGQLGANIVTNPLDAFGVQPKVGSDGSTAWEKTVPWANMVYSSDIPTPEFSSMSSEDPVSNNASGINFNYF
jgi:hypothetical protein